LGAKPETPQELSPELTIVLIFYSYTAVVIHTYIQSYAVNLSHSTRMSTSLHYLWT